jgi:hypothetical protein
MSYNNSRLRRGDLIEVKTPHEILETLDAEGAVDHLPFMPEMLEFCGRRFKIAARAMTVCASGPASPRGFRANDVVTLEGVRCSGAAHDGCQKACMIFWREAWLRKVEDTAGQSQVDLEDNARLRARLKSPPSSQIYYCQAGELAKATDPLSRGQRLGKYFGGLLAGNFSALQMARSIWVWLYWRRSRMFLGVIPRGRTRSTPTESLGLQPGEWVEVKSLQSITETLNERGQNRGLHFTPDMRLLCGERRRVKGRIDKVIVDGTGEMRQLNNTVWLEGSTCECSYMGGFGSGGCSRCEVVYWREIWLRRSDPPTSDVSRIAPLLRGVAGQGDPKGGDFETCEFELRHYPGPGQ